MLWDEISFTDNDTAVKFSLVDTERGVFDCEELPFDADVLVTPFFSFLFMRLGLHTGNGMSCWCLTDIEKGPTFEMLERTCLFLWS